MDEKSGALPLISTSTDHQELFHDFDVSTFLYMISLHQRKLIECGYLV